MKQTGINQLVTKSTCHMQLVDTLLVGLW